MRTRDLVRYAACAFLGHRWRPFDAAAELSPGVVLRYFGDRCDRCGWTHGRIEVTGHDGDQDLRLRHMLEHLEAKLGAANCRWTAGETDARP
jgi:hypothetical protein